MSLLFGHHGAKVKPQFTGLALQTSTSVVVIAIGMGLNRVAPNIIYQTDFKAHPQKQKTGKGLGGGKTTGYTYSGTFILALGWGPSGGVIRVWKDQSKETDYTKLGFVLIPGTIPQSPWGYLTANHPTEALGYPGLILMCVPNSDLGQSNTLSQHSFENKWPLYNTAPGGKGDADPAQCVDMLLNSSIYGALGGFPMQLDMLFSTGAATTTGDATFQTYCKAMGFGMSPLLDSPEQCSGILDRWTTIFNTELGWTGYSLLFDPLGPDTLTANGVTYLPDTTLEFALTDDNGDFIYSTNEDPVRLIRKRQSQCPNVGSFEIRNRSNEYNVEPAPWDDQGLIDQFGEVPASSYKANEICEPSIGVVCASLYGNRQAYVTNQFEFATGPGFMAYIPGSKGTITDPQFGLQSVKVIDLEENDDGSFKVLVEEYNGSISSASPALPQGTTNTPVDTNVSAAAVNTPIIFEPPSTLAGSTPQVWMAVSAGPAGAFDPNWGGAFVYLSSDNVTYQEVGEIDTAARMGVLTTSLASFGGTNPDTTHSFGVDLTESNGDLTGVTAADAAAFVTLFVIKDAGGTLEFGSYRDATLTATNKYTLGGQLYRGLYGTAAGAHVSGAAFARLDENIFKFDLPAQYIGKTLYVKLQSFNIFGGGVQDLSTCTAYTFTPAGTGYGGGSGGVPTTPATPSAATAAGANFLSWTANPASDNVIRYDVYRAPGLGAAFGSAALIGSGAGANYSDATATSGSQYTYFVKGVNAVGSSAASAGASITTGTAAGGALRLYGGTQARQPDPSEVLFEIEMVGGENFAAGFPSNLGGCDVAPTNAFSCPIYKAGSSVGSMDIAPGATSATWTLASPLSFTSGQKFKFAAPAIQDPTLSGLFYTFVGGR